MKSFLSGRTQISAQPLQSLSKPESGPRIASHSHPAGKHAIGTPNVECVRQGDKVVKLIVTCSCGERIEIDCLYPAGG